MKSTMMPVLVVEDNFLIAASLEAALAEAGHAVSLAGSVAEAEAALAQTTFCAALLDYVLPDGDSIGLARQLHAVGCRVALVSGMDGDFIPPDEAIAARFTKPTDERELIDWVGSVAAIGQSHAARGGLARANPRAALQSAIGNLGLPGALPA